MVNILAFRTKLGPNHSPQIRLKWLLEPKISQDQKDTTNSCYIWVEWAFDVSGIWRQNYSWVWQGPLLLVIRLDSDTPKFIAHVPAWDIFGRWTWEISYVVHKRPQSQDWLPVQSLSNVSAGWNHQLVTGHLKDDFGAVGQVNNELGCKAFPLVCDRCNCDG